MMRVEKICMNTICWPNKSNGPFRKEIKFDYVKVTNVHHAKQMQDNILNYLNNDFTVIVYNFIDMLSHARTEMEVLKELAGDEKAYRSLTKSWFREFPALAGAAKSSRARCHS